MEIKVLDIINYIKSWANEDYQEDWDNTGEQILFSNEITNSVVIGMDVSDNLIDLAIKNNSKLIITHHPFFFQRIKNIKDSDYKGPIIIKSIKNNISIYSSHTSLDITKGGVNHTLAKVLEIDYLDDFVKTDKGLNLGLICKNSKYKDIFEIKKFFNNKGIENIKIYGKKPKSLKKIALLGGAGAEYMKEALKKEVDLFITSDVKYHDGQWAYENNICVMDIGHFGSEKFIIEEISSRLKENFNIEVHEYSKNIFEI